MKAIEIAVVDRFAKAFCFGRAGFSLEEIPVFFSRYEGGVPDPLGYKIKPNKAELFRDCIQSLTPTNQRLALYDLCDEPPPSTHQMPSSTVRKQLLCLLVQADGRSPIGVALSCLSLTGVREQWMTAASRLPSSPSGAITAARTLVESTCRTILQELGESPDTSGDLGKLFKQTRKGLGIELAEGASQAVHKISLGLQNVIDGVAALSNAAGDRHGLANGSRISDPTFASLAVHAAGTICVFLVRIHKDLQRGPDSTTD